MIIIIVHRFIGYFVPSIRLYYIIAPVRNQRGSVTGKSSVGTYHKSSEIKSFFSNRIYIYIYIYRIPATI